MKRLALLMSAVLGAAGCSRVSTYSIDGTEAIGQGVFRVIAMQTDETYYQFGSHASPETTGRRWYAYETSLNDATAAVLTQKAMLEASTGSPATAFFSKKKQTARVGN